MDQDEDPTADEWRERAITKLRSAKQLAAHHSWQDAYDLAGQAVEVALKYKIMRVHGMNHWPSKRDRPELYTHDFFALLTCAGVDAFVNDEATRATGFGRAWMIIKDWSLEVRYPVHKRFPSRRARDMLKAVDDMGVLTWLLS